MKELPRIRKGIKWCGVVVTVVLVVVWVGSGWLQVARGGGYATTLSLTDGRLEFVTYHDAFMATSLETSLPWREGGIVEWNLKLGCSWTSDFVKTNVTLALWLPALACLRPTLAAWRLDTLARRRARLNLCPTGGCNYDRTGLASGAVCPECGAASVNS